MLKIKRIALLPLLLVSLPVFSLTGCAATETVQDDTEVTPSQETKTPTLSEQIPQILVDSQNNFEKLTSYKFNMVMLMLLEASGGAQSGNMSINYQFSGANNLADKQMQMKMDMYLSAVSPGEDDYAESMSFDVYMLQDWIYARMALEGQPEEWMRMPVTDEIEKALKLNTVDQQLALLGSPSDIEYLRDEQVNGLDCYVVSVKPSVEDLTKWFEEQNAESGTVNPENIVDFSNAIKDFSYLCYISKKSVMLQKVVFDIWFGFTPEQLGSVDDTIDNVTMHMNVDMSLSDQNVPFSVILPDEAANAQDVTPDDIIPQTR